MRSVHWFPILSLVGLLAIASSAHGQSSPYIGFVYPAGGQQGTTVQIKLGGQRIDGTSGAVVTGEGVTARLVQYYRRLSNQEMTLIREQLRDLKRVPSQKAKANPKNRSRGSANAKPAPVDDETQEIISRIETRVDEWCNQPACAALSSLAVIEVTIDPRAEPGPRELRLITAQGMTNPMPFFVGQVPEVARKPMVTSNFQVLGKEALAQRKRPPEEEESRVTIPCTMNGQIASGELNRYRFEAKKGQRLVVSVDARSLVPYIADAVPGWFQPVVSVCDADGNEVAYGDDFRFNPDPTLSFEVPRDGEYVLTITDALYRGREDFVYRVSVGEVPYLTSVFPLGGRVGQPASIEIDGWNLDEAKVNPPSKDAQAGIHWVTAKKGDFVTNRVPFALDTLPECLDAESNDEPSQAQKIELPMIVNGRIDKSDDWDVFQIEGKAGQKIVAEVMARRLDSPMDSMLKITDSKGKVLAFNDDYEDPGVGLNTHHADSYLMAELPADGTYYVHLGDTARAGGKAYAYRLRLSAPRPDFALRAVPSGGGMRGRGSASITVYAIRKDGFDGEIKVELAEPAKGFSSSPATLKKGALTTRLTIKTSLAKSDGPLHLAIEGRATIEGKEVVHEVVPAEDRMQAFLWRHLLPAEEFSVLVYNPSYDPPSERVPEPLSEDEKAELVAKYSNQTAGFTKRQVAGRLRQLKLLYEEWLLTDKFYHEKVAECEASME